ncbi:hypothetical protein Syun_020325 [Stephania yunnanensis]|uniref:BAHD acyltransferase n=1 Tax=Stephania yunnanensis TaxID=152371 RepID=A0AAP0NNS5_9MAGN
MPTAHVPVVFFYSPPLLPANYNINNHLAILKSSLSQTLTLFYPLAGRIKDEYHIDCNDDGVKFVHARVRHLSLSQALSPLRLEGMTQFFPRDQTEEGEVLGIQVTFFECGGVAVGVYLSHKIADAQSICTFALGWASTAKFGSAVLRPRFDLASVFPSIKLPPSLEAYIEAPTENCVDRVFRFEASKIAELKAKAKAYDEDEDPSKMMAVSAFLWSVFAAMGCGKIKGNNNPIRGRHCMLYMPVFLSGRVPDLHQHTMGNLFVNPLTPPMAPPIDLSAMPELVEALRDLVRKVDEGGIVKRRDGGELVKMMEVLIEASNKACDSEGELELYEASSWEFPFYDADFGWGRPAWVGIVNTTYPNIVICMHTKSGDGIDATITLSEKDMAEFESMPELLEYATPVHNALE